MAKIITEDFPSDNEVLVERVEVQYMQGPDNCSNEDDYQELILQTKDGGGGGKYINFKTGEHGWSFSDIEDDLVPIFKHFKKLYETAYTP